MTFGPRHLPIPHRGGVEDRPTVVVVDEQRSVPVDVARWRALAAQVLNGEGVSGDVELSILFVDPVQISALNREFMGSDTPTDVLSFPIDGEPAISGTRPDPSGTRHERGLPGGAGPPLLLGDVVVCPEVAAANAPDHAGSLDDEIALLVVHGILHLLGMDHAAHDDRVAMQARERSLLERFHGGLAKDPWAGDAAT